MQYRERIIFIGQKIDEEFGNKMVATMLYLDSESTKVRAWRAGGRAGARGGRAWSGVCVASASTCLLMKRLTPWRGRLPMNVDRVRSPSRCT